MSAPPVLRVERLVKSFTLHTQGGITLPVLAGVDLELRSGECVVLQGPSGVGKSTLLRCVYGNYRPQSGRILVRDGEAEVDMVAAEPRAVLGLRRRVLGYVSQFLRAVPRVPAIDVVAEPLRARGVPQEEAAERAAAMLARLNIPERLWTLAPATFSGGEQQRVNIARGFVADYPVLLLDEPTAALDAGNRRIVVELLDEARARGTAMLGVFHDREVREAVATRIFEVPLSEAA